MRRPRLVSLLVVAIVSILFICFHRNSREDGARAALPGHAASDANGRAGEIGDKVRDRSDVRLADDAEARKPTLKEKFRKSFQEGDLPDNDRMDRYAECAPMLEGEQADKLAALMGE